MSWKNKSIEKRKKRKKKNSFFHPFFSSSENSCAFDFQQKKKRRKKCNKLQQLTGFDGIWALCTRVHCFYAIFLLHIYKAQLLKGKHIKKSWRTQWNFSVEITPTIQMLNECMLSLELGTCIHLNSEFLYQFDCLLSSSSCSRRLLLELCGC